MTLDAGQRHYLVRDQLIVPALFNFALNAGIAWLLFRSLPSVPLWGETSLAGDAIATLFLLPSLTCLIVTPLVRHALRSGAVAPLSATRESWPALRLFPEPLTGRALALGVLGVAAGAPLLLGLFSAVGIESLTPGSAALLKGSYAAVLACAVNPLVALCALSDARSR